LIALARAARADVIVSGDSHLTELPDPTPPVRTPRQFIEQLTWPAPPRRRTPSAHQQSPGDRLGLGEIQVLANN
jgi:hypothetical protein